MAKKKFAPLASQETLDNVGQKKSSMIDEPWRKEGFNDIPRSEQIVQIFTVSGERMYLIEMITTELLRLWTS